MHQSAPQSSYENDKESYFVDHQSHHHHPRTSVSWGAIFAGTIAALGLHVLFMMLGTGLGLAVFSPLTDENPVADLSIGALVVHSICVIIALCLGGWVAGRFSPVAARATGWLHGFSVWAAATVVGVVLVALGAGAMLGGLTKIVGGGLSAIGQPAAEVAGGATDLAAGAMNQSDETIASYVDEAVSNLPEDGPERADIRATREVGMAVGRLFNPAWEGDAAANREAAITSLVDHTEMSRAEAERAVTDWTASYERLQSDLAALKETAATEAREAADSAADAISTFSWWAFFGFLIGALAATAGGYFGAKCATKCEEKIFNDAHVPTGTPRRVAVKVPASRTNEHE